MKVQMGSRGIPHSFFNFGTRLGWVINARPRLLYPQKRDPVPVVQEVGGPQDQSQWVWKFLPPPEFNSWTIQCVGSRYTDYTNPAHITLLNITVCTLRQSFTVH